MARSRYENSPHWHCCPKCRQRYEDTCGETDVNTHCSKCRGSGAWELLRVNREPKDCCVAHSRVVDKKECTRLGLAGDGTWWACKVCGRSQGYDPSIKVYRT